MIDKHVCSTRPSFVKMGKSTLPHNMSLKLEDQKEFSKKVNALKDRPTQAAGSGVVFLKHIPRGFFEPQMREYFSQFGRVKQLRLSRSKKSGRSKGYAYIQFAEDAVAKIVAEAMNNYLMFHRLLKCEYVDAEKLHPDTFKGANRIFRKPSACIIERDRHNAVKSQKKEALNAQKRKKTMKKSLARLAEMGVEYSFTPEEDKTESPLDDIKQEESSEEACSGTHAAAAAAASDSDVSETEVHTYDDSSDDDIDFDVMFGTKKSAKDKPVAGKKKKTSLLKEKNVDTVKKTVKRKSIGQKKTVSKKKKR